MGLDDEEVVKEETLKESGLFVRTHLPSQTELPIGIVVVVHGYSEHSGRYLEVAKTICKSNWGCVMYDVRGHGRSPGARGFIHRFGHYMTDLDSVLENVVKGIKSQSGAVVLFGHSNGGLQVLRYITDAKRSSNPIIKAAVLSAPFLATHAPLGFSDKMLVRVFSVLSPQMQNKFADDFPLHLSHDPAMHKARIEDQHCFNYSTVGWFAQAVRGQRAVLEHLDRISIPTFWFIAGNDLVCNSQVMKDAVAKLRSLKKTSVEVFDYPEAYHEIFFETTRDKSLKELQQILAKL